MDPITALILGLGVVALAAATLVLTRRRSAALPRSVPPPDGTPSEGLTDLSAGEPRREVAGAEQKQALKLGLAATRRAISERIASFFGPATIIDETLLTEIEEVLLAADVGAQTVPRLMDRLRERMNRNELRDAESVRKALREQALAVLRVPTSKKLAPVSSEKPDVVLLVGVNGAGKTTTIGKLASRLQGEGKRVVLAAGDTFRAAAVLQLEVWGRRVGCPVVKGKERGDPASVIFDAVRVAREQDADVVLADTAGRLHTKAPLMEELKKVYRTAKRALGDRDPAEVLLVLDATTGQNAIQQAAIFLQALPISGIVLTKLDGTAKGGVVLGIVDQHGIPVRYVGIGERVEDLRAFDPESFVNALFEDSDDATAT